ncbi:MAG: hypothetical protein N5P05_000175 [Chroococcopsis gigantea SAG 12.99]|jgi:hypothetical protein|nr:sulfotransferase domain-containing protein [Chlorogloea purpurea SAG 13.99]MDV2998569.1 hypothetical protein [Chroococcopsis gigantea SAG 12.99]
MRLPDFMIIGAPKAGTTSLYAYLCQHPQICMSSRKETQFFALDEKYNQGLEWYSSLFTSAEPGQICGEASTDYTKYPLYPETASRIAQILPDVKLIYIMRNPVDRAYSYYTHVNRGQVHKKSFEEHIQNTNISLDASNYIMQIEQYLKYFPKESFLFLLMEDFVKDNHKVMMEIANFLGVDSEFYAENKEKIVKNSATLIVDVLARQEVNSKFKKVPLLNEVAKIVPKQVKDYLYKNVIIKSNYGQKIAKKYSTLPMLPETRQMLIEKFKPQNEKLSQLIQRDLSHWEQ